MLKQNYLLRTTGSVQNILYHGSPQMLPFFLYKIVLSKFAFFMERNVSSMKDVISVQLYKDKWHRDISLHCTKHHIPHVMRYVLQGSFSKLRYLISLNPCGLKLLIKVGHDVMIVLEWLDGFVGITFLVMSET